MITITLKNAAEQHLVTVALRKTAADLRAGERVFASNAEYAAGLKTKADALERIADHVEEA